MRVQSQPMWIRRWIWHPLMEAPLRAAATLHWTYGSDDIALCCSPYWLGKSYILCKHKLDYMMGSLWFKSIVPCPNVNWSKAVGGVIFRLINKDCQIVNTCYCYIFLAEFPKLSDNVFQHCTCFVNEFRGVRGENYQNYLKIYGFII